MKKLNRIYVCSLLLFVSINCSEGVIDSDYFKDNYKFVFLSSDPGDLKYDVFLKDNLKIQLSRLTSTEWGVYNLELHPFLNQIIFTEYKIADADLTYIMNLDSNTISLIYSGPIGSPHFSADGKLVAFNDADNIQLLKIDDLSKIQLTYESGIYRSPKFSPDGSKIICQVFEDHTWTKGNIVLMDIDGSNQKTITGCRRDNAKPTLTPDMSKIFFADFGDQSSQIFCYDLTLNILSNISNTNFYDYDPEISPDGRLLTFTRNENGNTEIYSYSLDTESIQNLTNDPAKDNYSTFIDSERIVFTSNRSGDWDIYILNLTNRILTNITNSHFDDKSARFLYY